MRENDADLNLMSKVLKIDIKIANILANRNIRTKNKAIMFLSSSTRLLRDPNDMKAIHKALNIISEAIKRKEKIVIYGDYDVDGVMSTVILFDTLKKLNADVDFYLPDRTIHETCDSFPVLFVHHPFFLYRAVCCLIETVLLSFLRSAQRNGPCPLHNTHHLCDALQLPL